MLVAEVVEERIATAMVSVMKATSGPLPDSDELYKYTPEHQERIFRIAEAPTSDESKRRDKAVDATVKHADVTLWLTPALLILFGGASFAAFAWLQNNVAGVTFLAIPVLRFLGSFVSSFSMRSKGATDTPPVGDS